MDLNILAWTLIVSIGANLLFFILAFIIKSDKFTDITYASTFAVINLFALFFNQNDFSIIKIVVATTVCLWAVRLGSYLLIRIFKTKTDSRFDNIRNHFGKFFFFWIIQAFTAYIVSIPTIMLLATPILLPNVNYEFLAFLIIFPLFFLSYETIADIQKYKFHNLKEKPKFLATGLYKYSRFPNYFAEFGFWYSLCFIQFLYVFINKNFVEMDLLYLLNILCPIFLMLTVIYLSGIKILDVKNIKRYENDEQYLNYVQKTSIIIPFIGKKGYLNLSRKQVNKTKTIK